MTMNGISSTLARAAGIYTLSNVFKAAVPFLLMPVITRYLNPADYAMTVMLQVLVGMVAPFTGLSIHGAIARKYYDKDGSDLPAYVANCLFILLISSLLIGITFLAAAGPISEATVFPQQWLWSVIIVSVGQFISLVVLTLWQVRSKAVQYASYANMLSLFNAGFSICFVAFLGWSWQGWILAQVLEGTIAITVGLSILWKNGWIRLHFDPAHVRSALMFGVPLIPHAVGGWIMMTTDRLFINAMIGTAEMGIYSVGFQFSLIIALVETSFNTAWIPWFYEKLGKKDPATSLTIVKFTYLYVVAIFVLAAAVAWLAPWMLRTFVGKDFRGASVFITWLVFAKALDSMYYMTCNYIFYSTRTGWIAFATVVSAIVHIAATYVLIKMNGAIGAAQATVVSSFVSAMLVWWFAARLYKMPWLLGWSQRTSWTVISG